MFERFRRAINYWMFAVSHPGYVLETAQKDLHRVRISFYIILSFGLLYSFSSWMLWMSGRLPQLDVWVPLVPAGEHYLYQALWTVPWMVLTYLGISGFIHLFNCLARKEAYYEDSLMIAALSIAVPYLMFWWIPETFLLPAMGPGTALKWPELFELERKYLFPGLWQVSIVGFGLRKLYNTNRVACLGAGVMAFLVLLAMLFPYMR